MRKWSIILGIIACVMVLFNILSILSIIPALAGIIISIIDFKKNKSNDKKHTMSDGILISGLAALIWTFNYIIKYIIIAFI